MVQLEALWRGMVVAGFAMTSTSAAHAFCRTTTCDTGPPDGSACTEAQPRCVPVFWKNGCLPLAVHEAPYEAVSVEQIRAALFESASQWTGADCGGGPPAVQFFDNGLVGCNEVEFNRSGPNVNVVFFQDEEWPHLSAYALTTVQIRPDTGEILGVDMEVNSAEHQFSLEGGGIDLSSVLTHELGHAYGLAHSSADGATMLEGYHPNMRDLAPDDVQGVCAIYPPAAAAAVCSPMKNFSDRCGGHVVGTCSMTSDFETSAWTPVSIVVFLFVASRRRGPKHAE